MFLAILEANLGAQKHDADAAPRPRKGLRRHYKRLSEYQDLNQ